MTAAERLAAFATDLRYEDLPGEVVDSAKLHLLDTIGAGIAARALGEGDAGLRVVEERGAGGPSSAFGLGKGFPADDAAFANAMLCHALDFDDTHLESICHVSTVVVPATAAVAESCRASGADLVLALVIGNEVAVAAGRGVATAVHARGFHPTPLFAIFGAAAAVSRLSGLGAETLVNAFGIAGSMASGLFEYLADGSATKPIHAAEAARGAFVASRLAVHGATGPASVLEGRFGLYASHGGLNLTAAEIEAQLADLGKRWETVRISFKPYPACQLIHSALDSGMRIMNEHSVDAAAVEGITVKVPPDAVRVVLEPVDAKLTPRTTYDAKFSLQYSLASMLVDGRVDLDTYTEGAIQAEPVLALAKRVGYETHPYPNYPANFPAAVTVRLTSGEVYDAETLHEPGGSENPMSADAIRAKFRANAALGLGEAEVESLENGLLGIDELDDVAPVFAQLRSVTRAGEAG
jgi:2-methylcitrate dehydratase PrpD